MIYTELIVSLSITWPCAHTIRHQNPARPRLFQGHHTHAMTVFIDEVGHASLGRPVCTFCTRRLLVNLDVNTTQNWCTPESTPHVSKQVAHNARCVVDSVVFGHWIAILTAATVTSKSTE